MRRMILGSEVVVGVVWMEGGDGDLDLDSCTFGVDALSPSDIFVMSLTACSIQSPISFSPPTSVFTEDCAPSVSSVVGAVSIWNGSTVLLSGFTENVPVSVGCEGILSLDGAGVTPPAAALALLPLFAPP